jgi:hypothetical protein
MSGRAASIELGSPQSGKRSLAALHEAFIARSSTPVRAHSPRSWSAWLLALALLAGAGLRLAWPADIEYKADEAWTFARTQHADAEGLQWLGMPTSVEIRNPGMSLWGFQVLSWLFQANNPPALARGVQFLGILSIGGLITFARCSVPVAQREPWLWAAAFLSVNPVVILFERKIWPPSLLPIFIVVFLAAWWYRSRGPGAFFWGLLGACIGQIHLAAFFFAAGFLAWAACFEGRRVAWRWWALGTAIGMLPLIPWLRYFVQELMSHRALPHVIKHAFELKFWSRWTMEPLGLGLNHALGPDFLDFLRYPLVSGYPTFGVGLLHVLVAAIGICLLGRAFLGAAQIPDFGSRFRRGGDSSSAFTVNAALWGYGLCLTLSLLPIHRHYMIVTYPIEMLWLARLALELPRKQNGRRFLGILWVAQLLISISFLGYIHVNQGSRGGEYGKTYAAQPKRLPS